MFVYPYVKIHDASQLIFIDWMLLTEFYFIDLISHYFLMKGMSDATFQKKTTIENKGF